MLPHRDETATVLEPISGVLPVPVVCCIGAAKTFYDLPIEEWIEIPRPEWARDYDQFCAAKVVGESLYDDGIHDGDYVVFRTTFEDYELTPGALAAVFTPHGLLLKHVYFTLDDKTRLVSANPAYEDLLFDAEDVTVQGIAEELVRRLRR